ncbi:hypothetical protein [Streptomyces kronopolitis]
MSLAVIPADWRAWLDHPTRTPTKCAPC